MSEYITDTVVVRMSEYDTLKMMDGETQREAAMLLLEQAFTGEQQSSKNPMVAMFLRMSYDHQIATLERYHSAVRNGSTGGRPETIATAKVRELFEQGLTQETIADKLGCSISSVQKKLRQLGLTRNNPQKPVITGNYAEKQQVITGKNLNIDIDTDRDKDVYKNIDKDKDFHSDMDVDADTPPCAKKPSDHPYVGETAEQDGQTAIWEDGDNLPF